MNCLTFVSFLLVALVAVSEEVRSRCHVKHTLPRWPVESNPVTEIIAGDADSITNQTVSINQLK